MLREKASGSIYSLWRETHLSLRLFKEHQLLLWNMMLSHESELVFVLFGHTLSCQKQDPSVKWVEWSSASGTAAIAAVSRQIFQTHEHLVVFVLCCRVKSWPLCFEFDPSFLCILGVQCHMLLQTRRCFYSVSRFYCNLGANMRDLGHRVFKN